MALTKLVQKGFGQIEPTHLSAQRNGQIYAQLPVNAGIEQLENGQFVKYDYGKGEVNYDGDGEFMLVYNEVKIYDPMRQSYKDFVFKRADFTDGSLFPRVFKTMPGDVLTTNCVMTSSATGELKGKKFVPKNGFLTEVLDAEAATAQMVWICAKPMTMADGQPAVKLQRIK